ncbi:hypothetical protein ACFPN2_21535 [Steroidobacter flavus]|uniref:Uncharacterized protein n=1 Tax=Steroidobacter flavus TaxID=1842136 RepID=A0ABV8SVN9_9GAMM
MWITNSSIERGHETRRLSSVASTWVIVSTLALLAGCASNAPSCDGRFEPINVPAVSVAEDRSSPESDGDHERR